MRRAVIGFLALLMAAAALLFGAAGTAAWPMGWAYVTLLLVGTVGSRVLVARKNPELLEERARGLRAEGTRGWDRWLAPLVVGGPVVTLVVAGLDHRFGWSHMGPLPVQLAALLASAVGYAVAGWAMVENRYFVATARIQAEQRVVETGPYRWVRHPGYAGAVLATFAMPLVLDSAWAFVPVGITVLALVARTALEDRMLRRELQGYPAFAGRTRYRLVPRVW